MRLYLDIISGISGDMFFALLLGFKDCSEELSLLFSRMLDGEINISLENVLVNGIVCNRLNIEENIKKPFRHFEKIVDIIECAELPEKVKINAVNTLKIIAEAEAKVHNTSLDKIHFHEVGAVDTIIDVVGVSYMLDSLGINKVEASPAKVGFGTVKMEHGILPVPAPATVEILKGLNIERIDINDEITTPTGAALYKKFIEGVKNSFSGKLVEISYSTGTKQFENFPNMLRGFLLEEDSQLQSVMELEFNVDDTNGQVLGFLMEELFNRGAVDIFFTPIFMKKNRPAYKITVLCDESQIDDMISTVFRISSTIGVRFIKKNRVVMQRSFDEIEYAGEKVKIKKTSWNGIEKKTIEWEDLKKISKKLNVSPSDLGTEIIKQYNLKVLSKKN
ncbi:nickel pincer cofactor biosynthesis protein LarC [Deferribacter abyssi]|uniref:nickel pincer cofactor biosynthesis protein LarC n=1 Tax=Deferribacter abyssi TaxID=213806 RepID=UPI003C23C350